MENNEKVSKKEILEEVERLIKTYDNLPATAFLTSITHYEYYSLLLIISSILRSDCKE